MKAVSRKTEASTKPTEPDFKQKTVGQVMTPYNQIHWLRLDDPIGPLLMDELHKTKQVRFPMVKSVPKSAQPEIKGSLYIGDLLKNLDKTGKLRDLMKSDTPYIYETEPLEAALRLFLASGSGLMIVRNQQDELVGNLAIEQVLAEALDDVDLSPQPENGL